MSTNVAFQNGYIVHPIGFSTEVIKYSCDVQTASAIAENASEIFAQTLYKLVQWNFWKHYKLELKQIPIFSEYLLMIWYSDSKWYLSTH